MKKFMLFVLVAMLSGCATTVPAEDREEVNPHHSNAKKIGAFTVGAIAANAIARKTGAGQAMSYVVGLLGGLVGVDLVKGSEWKPGDDEIEYIDVPAGYSSGYSSCGAVNVYCDTTPKQGMYPPRPGMCNDPDSGGEATFEDLQRRAQRRAGCYDNSGYRAPHPQQHASYAPAQVVYPPNLWERPEKRQKTEAKKSARGPVVGPSVYNYTEEKMIHPDCKTKNPGADGHCLVDKAKDLWREQRACNDKKIVDAICPIGKYNPGLWAGIYQRLGNELIAMQDEMQGEAIK